MPTTRLQYFPIETLEKFIDALKKEFLPEMEIPDIAEFELPAPEIAENLRVFFSNFINADNLQYIMNNAPQSIKNDILLQFANCRLLCTLSRNAGLYEIAVPEDASIFLSVIPAELLLQLNIQRHEKGIRPTENDDIEYGGKFENVH